jgi:hypothetical protein
LIAAAATAVAVLGRAWWFSVEGDSGEQALWAATLCFALVVSSYAPIYDAILVVVAVALVAGGLRRSDQEREAFAVWLLLLYLVPWVTQSFAEFLHVQLLTLVLAGFGVWALRRVTRGTETSDELGVSQFRPGQEESTMTAPLQPPATGLFQVRSRGLP